MAKKRGVKIHSTSQPGMSIYAIMGAESPEDIRRTIGLYMQVNGVRTNLTFQDNLQTALECGDRTEAKIRALRALAFNCKFERRPKLADEVCTALIEFCKMVEDHTATARSYMVLASVGRNDLALENLRLAEQACRQIEDKQQKVQILTDIAIRYVGLRLFEKALRVNKTILKIGQELGNDCIIGRAYRNIGIYYRNQRHQKQTLRYYILAGEAFFKAGEFEDAGNCLSFAAAQSATLRKFRCTNGINIVLRFLIEEKGVTLRIGNDKIIGICERFDLLKPPEEGVIDLLETAARRATTAISKEDEKHVGEMKTVARETQVKIDKGGAFEAYEGEDWEKLRTLMKGVVDNGLLDRIIERLQNNEMSPQDFKRYLKNL